MQETSFFQTNVDEGSLHSRQHAIDLAFIDITDYTATTLSLYANFLQSTIFDNGNPGLLWRDINQYFFTYTHASYTDIPASFKSSTVS